MVGGSYPPAVTDRRIGLIADQCQRMHALRLVCSQKVSLTPPAHTHEALRLGSLSNTTVECLRSPRRVASTNLDAALLRYTITMKHRFEKEKIRINMAAQRGTDIDRMDRWVPRDCAVSRRTALLRSRYRYGRVVGYSRRGPKVAAFG